MVHIRRLEVLLTDMVKVSKDCALKCEAAEFRAERFLCTILQHHLYYIIWGAVLVACGAREENYAS